MLGPGPSQAEHLSKADLFTHIFHEFFIEIINWMMSCNCVICDLLSFKILAPILLSFFLHFAFPIPFYC